jgi:hypothetical protein
MDTMKKRLQVSSNFTETNAGKSSIFALMKKIYTKEGFFRGFYKGMTINFFKVSSLFFSQFNSYFRAHLQTASHFPLNITSRIEFSINKIIPLKIQYSKEN